jgi:hypothetical protein
MITNEISVLKKKISFEGIIHLTRVNLWYGMGAFQIVSKLH